MRTLTGLVTVFVFGVAVLASAGGTSRLIAAPASPVQASSEALAVDPRLYAAVLPEQRAEIIATTADSLSVYTIEATLVVSGPVANVAGTLDLRFVNDTGAALSELYLRLYPNDPRYGDGGIVLSNVTVDGEPIQSELSVDDTVARLALPRPIPAGGAAAVAVDFTTTTDPYRHGVSVSLLNVDPGFGTVALSHWYPMLAGYDPAVGWVLDPVSVNGDLVFANAALYDVALTVPSGLVMVASGVEVAATTAGDQTRHTYVTGPAREFTAIADNDFRAVRQEVAGTAVVVSFNPGWEAGAAALLREAAAALALFSELFGSYPYAELDVVALPMYGNAGIEFPQLVGVDVGTFVAPGAGRFPPEWPAYLVAHEIAHQWWYGLIGNNHYAHAFLDEGLADFSAVLYFERQHGAEAAERVIALGQSYVQDLLVDQPTDAFSNGRAYYETVYAKAATGFRALRQEIGDAAFFAGLRDYTVRFRFFVAAPSDLRAALERASSRDLTTFWHTWFESSGASARRLAVA